MGRYKIALNNRKPGNYAFYCPVSRLHLTLSHPAAYTDRVTSSILNGIRFGTLVDVDGSVAEFLKGNEKTDTSVPEQKPEPSQVQQQPQEKKKSSRKKTASKKETTIIDEAAPDIAEEIFGSTDGEQTS